MSIHTNINIFSGRQPKEARTQHAFSTNIDVRRAQAKSVTRRPLALTRLIKRGRRGSNLNHVSNDLL